MICHLLTRDNKGKLRFYILESDEEWHIEEPKGFIITKKYGQLGGKTTNSPNVIVGKKPAKKTWQEQLEIKFNSEKKKLLDKGYIELTNPIETYTHEELEELFGTTKTDQLGVIKPQLAKQSEAVTNRAIFERDWMISSKLDGTKALFYYKDGEIHTASRGGSNYDVSTRHLRTNPNLLSFFKANPTVVLDGELYVHNSREERDNPDSKTAYSLQKISGAVRTEDPNVDTSWIQYWIYDCYISTDPGMKARHRQQFLINQLVNKFNIPLYDDEEFTYPIMLLPQYLVSGWSNMMRYHDEYVAEGFEGAVIKDPEKPYKPGSRCNNLIKIKMRKEETFEVIGYELGARGSEDMVFVCRAANGIPFKAMPIGDREIKAEYVKNFEKIYQYHLADVTYFTLSDDGIPTQGKLVKFRFDLEEDEESINNNTK